MMTARSRTIAFTIVSFAMVLASSNASPRKPEGAKPWHVDGKTVRGEFIDLGKGDRIFIRYSTISDSGVEMERIKDGTVVWRQFAKPLNVAHSIYTQEVSIWSKDGAIFIRSKASGGEFQEKRAIEDGALIKRN